MKKYIITFIIIILGFTSCSFSNEQKNKELYKITDRLVESLYTEYESYGLFGGEEEYTPENDYKVMPIGRLINVRIEKVASDKEYDELIKELKQHYKDNQRVKDVYRCNAGTVMIDCRN